MAVANALIQRINRDIKQITHKRNGNRFRRQQSAVSENPTGKNAPFWKTAAVTVLMIPSHGVLSSDTFDPGFVAGEMGRICSRPVGALFSKCKIII